MFKRILHSMAIFLFLLVSLIGSPVSAAVPKPQGDIYVQDFANLLDDSEKQELIQLGRTLEDQTKAQIAVLTVNSLEDQTPEEYALEAFRTYELGDKELNNGVLLLIANKDRKARIEVGYGLEGALPDGKVGQNIGYVYLFHICNLTNLMRLSSIRIRNYLTSSLRDIN